MEYTLGMNPTITLNQCSGDLRIEAHDKNLVQVFDDDEELQAQQSNDGLTIEEVDSDLVLHVPYGTTFTIQSVEGDTWAQGVHQLQIKRLEGDCKLNNVDTFRSDSVEGDLKATQTRVLQVGRVSGDFAADNTVEEVDVGRVDGDMSVSNSQASVKVQNVNGDFRLENVSGKITAQRVAGDALLRGDIPGFEGMTVNGDAKFRINWQADNDYRATVNGDAVIELADDANVTLSATVFGDVSGMNTVNDNSATKVVSAAWGDGAARIELTVHGDLVVRSGYQPHSQGSSWNTNWGMNDELRDSFRGLTEEFAAMGREIAAQFSDFGREWKNVGSERMAERIRQAADRMTDKATAAAERVSVRVNDREIRFDPDRLERIREQARRAADEGIARAQEAIDRAMDGLERSLSGRGRPPMPPRPPAPPAPPAPPQRISIMDNDGSSSTNTVQSPATGQTINLKNEQAFAVGEQQSAPQSEADKTQERLAILKMVQAGKISADEAALLLDALG